MNRQLRCRMKFKEHGVFEIEIEDTLLRVDATGPFNDEVLKRYKWALESCILQLEGSQWSQVITLHRTSLFTPEAEKILTDTLIKRKSRGLQAGYLILEDVDFKSLVKEQLSRCYIKAGVEHQFFDSTSTAVKWITHPLNAVSMTHSVK